MRTIAPRMPSHACPGSAAEGPRRGLCRRRQRYKYVSVVERLCTEKAEYINSAPLYICRVVHFRLQQRRGAGLVCDSVAALDLESCNEQVTEANDSRPHSLAPRVLCTVPTQSSKLERSEKQLNFLVRETCAHATCISMIPGKSATRS